MDAVRAQLSWGIGCLLLVLGLIGFVAPGLVDAQNQFVGFIPDTTRSLFYIAVGAVGVFSIFERQAFKDLYLRGVGAVFMALALDGLVWGGSLFRLFPVLTIDHYFHAVIGIIAIVVSLWSKGRARRR